MPEYFLSDTNLPPYMAFPRFLMKMDLNDTARIVYMLLLDRCRISQKNVEWCDENGAVFVIYPVAKLAETLHRSSMTVKTALAALENAGLIRRERTGVGRPNRIYVLLPAERILSICGTENCPEIIRRIVIIKGSIRREREGVPPMAGIRMCSCRMRITQS